MRSGHDVPDVESLGAFVSLLQGPSFGDPSDFEYRRKVEVETTFPGCDMASCPCHVLGSCELIRQSMRKSNLLWVVALRFLGREKYSEELSDFELVTQVLCLLKTHDVAVNHLPILDDNWERMQERMRESGRQ